MKNNIIEKTLTENIRNLCNIFVFPTQMAADLWADRATLTCGVTAVSMERFVAWDDFKGKSIRTKQQSKTSIPSVMRNIFATKIIEENSENPFLKSLIVPEFASRSSGFVDWITSLLPSLSLWKKHFDSSKNEIDDEDSDLLELYNRYKNFLDSNNFFDPAWETPPFESDGNHYFIFFPEILSDYTEYKEILESTEDITQIHFDLDSADFNGSDGKKVFPDGIFYSNTRSELKNLSLRLRSLHEKNKIDWQEMCVSVPDIETYGSYITRDFKIYQIPFVMKNAKPLSSSGAGNFFSLVSECVSSDFAFESVKNLILNTSLPWKEEDVIQQVIEFGKNNNCITSFDYNGSHFNPWDESFKIFPSEERAKIFFEKLKKSTKELYKSESFSKLREAYFSFRESFFDMTKCTPESDRILSRCISELGALIDIEEAYPDAVSGLKEGSYFAFFVKLLDSVKYLAQTSELGVQILPYKTAACAPFKFHAVVDASQAGLSVVYKELSFLRDDKRRKILFGEDSSKDDPNVSEYFVRLYEMNSEIPVRFSCSSKTVSGYAQVSSYLKEISETEDNSEKACDFISEEKNWYLSEKGFPDVVSKAVKNGFEKWRRQQKTDGITANSENLTESEEMKSESRDAFFSNDGKLIISASTMKKFFKCPRELFFEKVTDLSEINNEAKLMKDFVMGNLNHKIFELYFSALLEKNVILGLDENGKLPEENVSILKNAVDEAIQSEIQTDSALKKDGHFYKNSILATELIKSSKASLFSDVLSSLTELTKCFSGCKVHSAENWYNYPAKNSEEYKTSESFIAGKIDLVLYDCENDELIIVDYKTSKSSFPKEKYANDWEADDETITKDADFQMPLYIKLLEYNNGKTPVKIQNTCFYSIKDKIVSGVTGTSDFKKSAGISSKTALCSREKFEATMKYLDDKISEFKSKILESDFALLKDSPDFEKCSKCNYKAVCRRTFNISKGN